MVIFPRILAKNETKSHRLGINLRSWKHSRSHLSTRRLDQVSQSSHNLLIQRPETQSLITWNPQCDRPIPRKQKPGAVNFFRDSKWNYLSLFSPWNLERWLSRWNFLERVRTGTFWCLLLSGLQFLGFSPSIASKILQFLEGISSTFCVKIWSFSWLLLWSVFLLKLSRFSLRTTSG